MDHNNSSRKPLKVHLVTSTDSNEFTHLTQALTRTSLVGLDAEWKPIRTPQDSFPTVSLLQIACRLNDRRGSDSDESGDSVVFLLDLYSIPLPSIWVLLRDVFVSPDILKLGFRFKQDLVYLSSTFCAQGCDPGFDWVEPFLDITSVYNHLQHGRNIPKQNKSLATICGELLGFSLSKELQCSDWSRRPLTEEQITYAAMDAHCLLKIFNVLQEKVSEEGIPCHNTNELSNLDANLGLKEILREHDMSTKILRTKFSEALDIVRASTYSDVSQMIAPTGELVSKSSSRDTLPMDESLLKIVKKYGEKILLKESDKKPKASKRKGKRQSSINGICKEKPLENVYEWEGPPPWDLSIGGDGCPKFLCDVMVEGLAKHLRCVGVDAAIPYSKKPEPRDLIGQANREKRVLLTRDAKLLRHEYLIKDQLYRVKSLLKNEQLLEVIETFELNISEDQLMSRCTKCNGRFIQKPLSTEEAVEAAKGFQRIPNCLFDKNLEFWQCMDCRQLYWEGTQYHNAVQKFIDVCKLSD
ncbi:exonuclease mut-7-like [Quillaja saponaria]|uniref:Exonuclease mut-7-like n=1 Tax=Quillaja saponaria TaxID=32244 RepID=A0AAD7PSB9_QUISA|nr:exonuclease mut-7-like [Quillaja saponaria]